MGTSAFDKLWDTAPQKPTGTSAFDALWDAPQKHDYHAEYRSGALQKRMAGANARDAANLADEQASQPGYLERFATHALNAAQGIPGVEAVEAAAGALGSKLTGRPQTYRQALGTLKTATGQIGGKTAMGERILGSTAVLPFLPANPVLAGAALGGADQALSADPDASLAGRAGRTVLGAAGGAAVGKAAEFAPTFVRGVLAKNPAANLLQRQASRAQSAKALYDAAIQGGSREPTQAVQKFLAEPDIAALVGELQQSRPLQGVAAHDPRMLDAIYKTLSDRAAQLQKGLDAVSPNRPNIGRFRLQDTKAAQQKLLDALEQRGTKTVEVQPPVPAVPEQVVPSPTTAQSPAPDLRDAINNFWTRQAVAAQRGEGTVEQQMARQALERHGMENVVSPSLSGAPGPRVIPGTPAQPAATAQVPVPPAMAGYRDAVTDFAQRSADITGVKRGYDALRTAIHPTLPRGANLTRITPEALAEDAASMSPSVRSAVGEGVLGGTKMALKQAPLTTGRKAVSKAPSIMRAAGVPQQQLIDALTRMLLTGGNAAF